MREVALGNLDPEIGRTIKALCDTALKALKDGLMAARLKQVESTIARLRAGQQRD
jgi:hypothetical protein